MGDISTARGAHRSWSGGSYTAARLWCAGALSALALGCSTSNTTGDRSGAPRSNAPTSPSSTNTTTGGQSASVPPAGATGAAGTFVVGTSPPNTSTAPPTGCKNLQCQQHGCAAGATTISGRVFDPAGKNPLYNVAVYVPNEPVLALKPGASCDSCDAQYSGKAVVSTLTDATGHFTLDKAPDGENIPLVVQIGKWRKQVTIPSVARCQDTALPKELTTLPRNRMEGDLPNIAIATGGADTLECLLRRVGLDASEYTPGAGGEGHVHIFQGGPRGRRESPNTDPAAPLASAELWSSVDKLMAYDVVLLSCEGQETLNMNQQALHDYADRGGRVFASHYHYSWFNTGPYASEELAVWTPGGQDVGDINGSIVTTFPKGKALAQWLEDRHVLVNGELPIQQARHNADVDMANDVSQPWIVGAPGSPAAGATQYFSFNTPTDQARVPDGKVCGRVVFSDLHVGAASADQPERPVPTGCSNVDLSAQEMALEFMLFDLSACVIPDDVPPEPPPDLH